jgi:hypothetical protein
MELIPSVGVAVNIIQVKGDGPLGNYVIGEGGVQILIISRLFDI